MKNMDIPRIIDYIKINSFEGKDITINEIDPVGEFEIKRLYWINYTCPLSSFSEHAHKSLRQIIVLLHGQVNITLESPEGEIFQYTLDNPSKGIYIPALYWKKIEYINPSILLCLASEHYDENDYIRSHEEFLKFTKE
jgi:hypothetical protein